MRSCVCVCVFDKGAATDKKCGEIERENQPKGRDMKEIPSKGWDMRGTSKERGGWDMKGNV